MLGVVTWFNIPKGYGEIYAETGEVFFFTYHELPKSSNFRIIDRGAIVKFTPSDSEHFGERKAANIRAARKVSNKNQSKVDQLLGVLE